MGIQKVIQPLNFQGFNVLGDILENSLQNSIIVECVGEHLSFQSFYTQCNGVYVVTVYFLYPQWIRQEIGLVGCWSEIIASGISEILCIPNVIVCQETSWTDLNSILSLGIVEVYLFPAYVNLPSGMVCMVEPCPTFIHSG